VNAWRELEPAWRAAFELAWEAFAAGTIPVGAIVTDADGTVLARGRNRITESSAPEGQIFGSRVAHAEINALVQLGMGRRYVDCTLWTTLEPCAQCIGAAWLSTIGRVAFAATDVYGGASKLIERQIEAADSARNFHMEVDGPLGGPLAVFSELLHVAFFVDRPEPHPVAQTFRELRPHLVALAERVRLENHAAEPVGDVVELMWDDLARVQPAPRQRQPRPLH
jgi:tRNA(adenine34) deaminase